MSSLRRGAVVAEMTVRELLRRRGMLALLVLVPLAFSLASGDRTGRSIRFAALGTAWAISTLGLFAALGARGIDRRLRIGGYRSTELVGGRLGAVVGIGAVLSAGELALVGGQHRPDRLAALALMFATVPVVSALFGTLCAAIVPRDLEGALLLMALTGMQFTMDPGRAAAKLLPFWSIREFATYAVDHTATRDLYQALLHVAAYSLLAGVALVAVQGRRLRRWANPPLARPATDAR